MRRIKPSLCLEVGDGKAGNRLKVQASNLTKLKLLLTERKQDEYADEIYFV